VTQGRDPGEYRGLTLEEQQAQNAMYRDLNEWNLRAIKIIEARDKGECSCGWFSALERDPHCVVHKSDTRGSG